MLAWCGGFLTQAEFEAEVAKILSESRDEALKRMRGQKPDGKQTETTEQIRFEEAKKTTAKTLEKMKALRTKAADWKAETSGRSRNPETLKRTAAMVAHEELTGLEKMPM